MKQLSTLAVLFFFGLTLPAQNLQPGLIAASGGSGSSESGSLSWSVGELAVVTFSAAEAQLTQGFHQNGLQLTPVVEIDDRSVQIDVFPNPTSQALQVKVAEKLPALHYQVLNLFGEPVRAGQLEGGMLSVIDLKHLPAQTYILKLFSAFRKEAAVFKIQKID